MARHRDPIRQARTDLPRRCRLLRRRHLATPISRHARGLTVGSLVGCRTLSGWRLTGRLIRTLLDGKTTVLNVSLGQNPSPEDHRAHLARESGLLRAGSDPRRHQDY